MHAIKNYFKKRLLVAILIFFLPIIIWFGVYFKPSTIKEIDTLAQAQSQLDSANNQTLVLFDVDETLVYYPDDWSIDFLEHPKNIAPKDAQFVSQARIAFKKYKQKKGSVFVDTLIRGCSILKAKGKLIEPNTIIDVINNLKLRGAKVIALTSFPVGKYGVVDCAHAVRFKDLQNLNIDFSSAFPQKEITLNNFICQNGNYPLFYKGILFTNWINNKSPEKGPVLGAFLDNIAWKPSNVLFFDDSKYNCESIEKEMNKRGIKNNVYWYHTEAKLLRHKLNKKTALIRLNHLLENDEYLTDAEAEVIVQKIEHSLNY